MNLPNQYDQYKSQSIQTLTPGERIVVLYEQVILNIKMAVSDIEGNRICEAHNRIIKTQNIFLYLLDSLDFDFPISKDLMALYEHLYHSLVKANTDKDVDLLHRIEAISIQMKETWEKANDIVRTQMPPRRAD